MNWSMGHNLTTIKKKKAFFSSLYFLYFLYFPLKIKTLKIYFDNNQFPTFYIWFSYWKKNQIVLLEIPIEKYVYLYFWSFHELTYLL